MPTPFTHLETAQRLLRDTQIPQPARELLEAEKSAFLLGNVAADARVDSGLMRGDTHFYVYDQPITQHPWRVMLERHPTLKAVSSAPQQAFLAGYVAHLCMDEIWSLHMLRPYFVEGQWGTQHSRYFMLHILLIYMDERDYHRLEDWQRGSLFAAQPMLWTPFMSDAVLRRWRDFIAEQLPPEGESQTLRIFGQRIDRRPEDFREILDSPDAMLSGLWTHIPPALLQEIEAKMYAFAREQMILYLTKAK